MKNNENQNTTELHADGGASSGAQPSGQRTGDTVSPGDGSTVVTAAVTRSSAGGNSALNAGLEGSAKAGPTDPSHMPGRKVSRSGAAKRRARKARLAALDPSDEPSRQGLPTEGTVVTGAKRPRSADKTPPELAKVVKRSRLFPRPAGYGEAVTADRRLAIVPANYPEAVLGQGEDGLVARGLLEALDAVPKGQVVPCFEGTRCDRGVLWVDCSDEPAKEWLRTIVPNLKPWEGASLQVLEKERLPKLKRVTAVLPGTTEGTDVILNRLNRQSPGLRTPLWRVWDRKVVRESVHLVLGVDCHSLETLRGGGFAPHFGLGRARFYEAHHRAGEGERAADPAAARGKPGKRAQRRPAPSDTAGLADAVPGPSSTPDPGWSRFRGTFLKEGTVDRTSELLPAPSVQVIAEPTVLHPSSAAVAREAKGTVDEDDPQPESGARGPGYTGRTAVRVGTVAFGDLPIRPEKIRGTARTRGRPPRIQAVQREGLAGTRRGIQRTLTEVLAGSLATPPVTGEGSPVRVAEEEESNGLIGPSSLTERGDGSVR